MGNITIGRYLPYDSFIHRLDPRLKIMMMFVLLITVFFNIGFMGYAILAVFIAFILKLSKLKLNFIMKSLRPMMIMLSFLVIINLFIIRTGNVIIEFGSIKIYSDALYQTAYVIIRLVLIVCVTTTLTATTKPLDLTLGIEKLLNPFRKIGFPSHEIALMISIALRFIPTLLEETQRIMKAQASRGVDFKEGKLTDKITAIISLIVPLFISAFQRAEDLANAMEARGYVPDGKRTRYKVLHWNKHDTLSTILTIAICVSVIVAGKYIW